MRTVGHYAPWVLAALLGGVIVLTAVPALTVPWPALLAVLVGAGYLALCLVAHDRRLCERCIRSVPLDASRVAARYRVRFRVAHLFEHRPLAVGYLGAVLATALLAEHPVGRYVWAASQASLGYLLFVYVAHRRFQPWCPRCRTGGSDLVASTPPKPVSPGL